MPQTNAAFYGQTSWGKKVHLGTEVVPYPNVDSSILVVRTFCGAYMVSPETGSMPPGSYAKEFCKLCFRTYAFDLMVEKLEKEASEQDALAARLELMARTATAEDWSSIRFLSELNDLAEELRQSTRVLPQRPHFKILRGRRDVQ